MGMTHELMYEVRDIIIHIYKIIDIKPTLLEELKTLKKLTIIQTHELDGFIAVSRYATSIVTLRREIKSYQICHTTTN